MDPNFIPIAAAQLGVAPSTLVFYLFVITTAANAISRLIPDTATGWLGAVRKVCSFIGVRVQSRVAPGVTMADVTKASLAVPVIAETVLAPDTSASLDSRARNGNSSPATRLVSAEQFHRPTVIAGVDVTRPEEKRAQAQSGLHHEDEAVAAIQRALDSGVLKDVGPVDIAPNIPGDALSVPVIDLRKPPLPPSGED